VSIVDPASATDELAFLAARLSSATSTEQVFGALAGSQAEQLDQLRRLYRQLALGVHPDRHANDPAAQAAFVALQRFYEAAQAQIADGRYGQSAPISGSVVLSSRRRTYTVGAQLTVGDLAVLYTGIATERQDPSGREVGCILKVARDPADNDLLANEASVLRHLAIGVVGRPVPAYIPRLLESFRYQDEYGETRQVNAFPLVVAERGPLPADEFYTLGEIRQAYPDGVEAGHMAWIWRRVLLALVHAHEREVIHGAVLPTHILIHPEEHGLLLVDWTASVLDARHTGAPIPVVSAEYEGWYPLSVLAKAPSTPTIDLEMGLRSMVYLLGGDPLTGALPPRVPSPIQTYVQSALWTSAARTDAGQLYRDFAELLADLWGARRFMPFAMPARR
jgi:hypothetical protein